MTRNERIDNAIKWLQKHKFVNKSTNNLPLSIELFQDDDKEIFITTEKYSIMMKSLSNEYTIDEIIIDRLRK